MRKLASLLMALSLAGSYTNASSLMLKSFENKNYIVFKPLNLTHLQMRLQREDGEPLHSFSQWQRELASCQSMLFAMNAGMYHANYQPVGLYIEKYKQHQPLNVSDGAGNFFMQPNGVLAWDAYDAVIATTSNWQKHQFKAEFATQSGPMLVIDGAIHPKFIRHSDSKKFRNGVGIKENQLYFVISQQRVNFYEFAEFFKDVLQVEHALYLDGSISSIYAPKINRHDRAYKLGPILGYVVDECDQDA